MTSSAADDDAPLGEDPAADDTLPPGNPLRLRALPVVLFGLLAGVLCAASTLPSRVAVWLGGGAASLVCFGVLDLLGSFDDDEVHVAYRSSLTSLRRPLAALLIAAASCGLGLRLAVAGYLPPWLSAMLIPAAFIASVVTFYRLGVRLGPWRADEAGQPRPLHRRHGFWLVLIATLLYLPMLGNHSLIDPWEPHYGEVAREILARDDWVSLWWAQDGWFWSKPVLSIWLQSLAMAGLGVHYEPGTMLSNAAQGLTPQPEWALRMPIFLMTLIAVYLLYKGVAKSHGRRAGLLGGLVLLTMPQFFLVSHQTMTDMPFVAAIGAAIGLFAWAMRTPPEQRARGYEVSIAGHKLRFSLFHVVIGAVLLTCVPQIIYLLSRHLELAAWRIHLHADVFASGSPGNCGLPGNAACQQGLKPAQATLQPALQAVNWLLAVALLLWLSWGERRAQRLLYLAAWWFAALATMAKGPAGIGLPALAGLAYVAASGRWRDLTRMEISAGLLIFVVVVMPWFVAMFARHGQPFVDRLLFHDMFKRAFRHVHDTNTGVDTSFRYYVWQLGYATFPWSGLVPIALIFWLRRRGLERPLQTGGPDIAAPSDTALLLAAWFFVGFALFTFMGTKFHHYCLPIVPPLGMLTGILLDRMLASREDNPIGEADGAPDDLQQRNIMLGCAAVGGALMTLLVGRDLAQTQPGLPSQIRLLQLFTYNYERNWPDSLDYSVMLWFFVVAASLATLLLVVHTLRHYAALALVGVSLLFAAWGLDVYLVQLSPHWGQRELHIAYEREREHTPGDLVAYQMNWKGENLYAGNHVASFVSSGVGFKDWIKAQREKGVHTLYFMTEHRRSNNLHRELGQPKDFTKLTDPILNNKFLLIRARF